MTTYRWKPGVPLSGDAQSIGKTFEQLIEKYDDRLTARVVVDEARPDSSPLHRLFEWDDLAAAERYRESQARLVMRSIEVIRDGEDEPQKLFLAVIEKVGGDNQKAYVTTARVMSDPDLTAQVLKQAMADLESFRNRYGKFVALAEIADTAQQSLNQLLQTPA